MAHHKSAVKRIKTSERSRIRNKSKKTTLRTAQKAVLTSSGETTVSAANKLASLADRAARKGIIHRNKAARIKSAAQKKAAASRKSA